MDSPIRQQLKRNDYQRHKLFRKMARRRKAKKEQELKAAEKELKRKLRIPRYEDGKPIGYYTPTGERKLPTASDGETVDQIIDLSGVVNPVVTYNPETGELTVLNVINNPVGYRSAYHPEDVEQFFNLTGAGLIFNPFRLARTSTLFLDKPSFENAMEVGHDALPWSKAGRFLLGTYNLANEEGIAKTYNLLKTGQYGSAALSGLGDLFNAAMAVEGGSGAANQIRKVLTQPRNGIVSVSQIGMPKLDAGLTQEGVAEIAKAHKKLYTTPDINISTKDFYKIVNKDGSVNEAAFKRAIEVYGKLNGAPHDLNSHVGSDVIARHIMNVVKTALDSPVPVGSTKQELVGAALLHDIGKIYGYEGHETKGGYMLNKRHRQVEDEYADDFGTLVENSVGGPAISNVPQKVKYAIRHHGDTTTFNKEGYSDNPRLNLTRATLFADVARGLSYDEAAIKYPHVLYERQGLKKPEYPTIPLREEIRKYINPWLKDNGYGPSEEVPYTKEELAKMPPWERGSSKTHTKYTGIPLDATEEEAWQIVEDAVKQHRRVLRGSRISTDSNSMSTRRQKLLAEIRDEHLANTIKDRPITLEDRLLWENEHINGVPTGYGRLNIWDVHDSHGDPYHTQQSSTRYYKIDPKKYDVKYTSLSDDVSDHYASSTNGRDNVKSVAQLSGGVERAPGMSMREYIAKNDWDLYSGGGQNPIGIYNMLESPFRLQTGRSLKYESSKGIYPKRRGIPKLEPLTDKEREGVRSLLLDNVADETGEMYRNYRRLLKFENAERNIEHIEEVSKKFGLLNFKIQKGKNGEIYYPEQLRELSNELASVDNIDDFYNRKIKPFKQNLNNISDLVENGSFDYKSAIKTFMDPTYRNGAYSFGTDQFAVIPDYNIMSRADFPDVSEAMIAGDIYNNFYNMFFHLLHNNYISQKEWNIIRGQLFNGDIDKVINYINKRDLLNISNLKRYKVNAAKKAYFDAIKTEKENAKKIDVQEYIKQVNDPKRLVQIMRKYGAIPRHEMLEFNRTMSIQTNGGTTRKGGNAIGVGKIKNLQMATVGKFGEKVLDAEYNEFNSASNKSVGKGNRDVGRISDKKLTHKTLASVAALFGLSGLIKPKKKQK